MSGEIATFFENLRQQATPAMAFPVVVLVFLAAFYAYYIKILQPQQGTTEWINMRVVSGKRTMAVLHKRHSLTMPDVIPLSMIMLIFLVLAIISPGGATRVDGLMQAGDGAIMHQPLGRLLSRAATAPAGGLPIVPHLLEAACGFIMLPVMYIFLKNLFGKTSVALCGTLLLAFELSRTVLARVGNIDIIAGLFILLSYFYMYRLITKTPSVLFRKSLPSLALSGLFFALAVSVSWVGLFAGIGLLAIFIVWLVQLGLQGIPSDTTAARDAHVARDTHAAGHPSAPAADENTPDDADEANGYLSDEDENAPSRNTSNRPVAASAARAGKNAVAADNTLDVDILAAIAAKAKYNASAANSRASEAELDAAANRDILEALAAPTKKTSAPRSRAAMLPPPIPNSHATALNEKPAPKRRRTPRFSSYLILMLVSAFAFFVVTPFVISYLCYIIDGLSNGLPLSDVWNRGYLDMVADARAVFRQDAAAAATEGIYWWQWILNAKPTLLSDTQLGSLRSTYAIIGNPMVYWGGIAAFAAVIVSMFKYRDGKAFVIAAGAMATLLPWLVPLRPVPASSYFPFVSFLVLSLAYVFNVMSERDRKGRKALTVAYTALTGVIYCIFYPILSGIYLPNWYYDNFAKWFPSWPF